MFKFLFAVVLFFTAIGHADDGIYLVKIDVKNAKTGNYGRELGSKITALKSNSIEACIDFMSGSVLADGGNFTGDFKMVTSIAPQPAEIKLIKSAVCGADSNCSVNVSSTYFENSEIKIGSYGESDGSAKLTLTLLPILKKMPRFSHSCEDGESYWNDAANTKESRDYLSSMGLNLEKSRTLELIQGDDGIYSFGFPKHGKFVEKAQEVSVAKPEIAPAAKPSANHEPPPAPAAAPDSAHDEE